MKQLMITFLMVAVLISCGDNTSTPTTTDATTNSESVKATDPEVEKGLELVATSDCLTCHKVDEQLVGPSYISVAQKYKDSAAYIVDTISQRIMRGSKGHWGTAEMTPHPTLSKDTVQAMVKYVLSLNQ